MPNPLSYWESLTQAVRASIAKELVGTPVFVRWTLLVARDRKDFESLIAKMLLAVDEWFESEVVRLMALAPDDPCALAVSAEFAGGETALLTAGISRQQPAIDFILLGNEGASYQHELSHRLHDQSFAVPKSAATDAIVERLRDSLRLGTPIKIGA